jgi:hypothetical protein
METIMIIVLLIIAIIFLIILINVSDENKFLNIVILDCATSLENSNKENAYLKSKNENLNIKIEAQNQIFKELENEFNLAMDRINENNNFILFKDSKISKLENIKKQYSKRIFELHDEKRLAINQSKSAIKLCNKMANKFKAINSELETIESDLLQKLNP